MKILKKVSLIIVALIISFGTCFALSGCKDNKKYNQLYVFCSQGGYVVVDGQSDVVKNGDEGSKIFKIEEQTNVKLKAIANNGYVFSEWEYAESLTGKYDTFSHQAEINLISDEDIMVIRAVFVRVSENTVGFNFVNGEGYEVKLEAGYSTVIEKGGSVKFKIELKSGYEKSSASMVVKNNGTIMTAENGIYTISNVQEDIDITVENVTKNTYKATIPTDSAYILGVVAGYDVNNIVYGTDFKFYLTANSGYSIEDFTVKVNGVEVVAVGNVYTVSNVTKDLVITVENKSVTTYTITALQYSGVTVKPVSNKFTVLKGEDFEFTITANAGVDISSIIVLYKTSSDTTGKVISSVNGKYTIKNVNSNIQIEINNIIYSKFTITTLDDRITISPINVDECLVKSGSNFVFTINLKPGYYAVGEMVVKANGIVLNKTSEQYTINNVTENQIITVEAEIARSEYAVTMPSSDLFDVVKENNSVFTADELNKIAYGTDLKFKVKLTDKSTGSPVVSIKNGEVLTSNSGVYTVKVKSNIEIVVSGVEIKKLNVILPTVSGVEFINMVGTVITGSQQVKYGENFNFKINTDSTISSFTVEVDGTAIPVVNEVYIISNITSNKQITVKTTVGTYTIKTQNPLRGASFNISNYSINFGSNCDFSVVVDNKYNFNNISVIASAGTVQKGGRKDNGDGTSTVNFTLKYSTEIASSKLVTLSIKNVYFEYQWIIDYATNIGEFGNEADDLPQKVIYRLDIYEELKNLYINDDFVVYAEDADAVYETSIASIFQAIKDVYLNLGYNDLTIKNQFDIGDKVFITLDVDVINIDWSLINTTDKLYNIIVIVE